MKLIQNCTVDVLGGYGVGIYQIGEDLFILSQSGPHGWQNFGDFYDHLVGYSEPYPVIDEVAILSTFSVLTTSDAPTEFHLHGPSMQLIPDHEGPEIFEWDEDLHVANTPSLCGVDGLAMLINSTCEPVATEKISWTAVKTLFD